MALRFSPQALAQGLARLSMPKYITPEDLAVLIKTEGKHPGRDYQVIDVRDDDYSGGNILGCKNIPSGQIVSQVPELIEETKDVPMLVFHCALSQVRGPKAARVYENMRQALRPNSTQDVFILQGGFSQFQARFNEDKLLVENFDKAFWDSQCDWA